MNLGKYTIATLLLLICSCISKHEKKRVPEWISKAEKKEFIANGIVYHTYTNNTNKKILICLNDKQDTLLIQELDTDVTQYEMKKIMRQRFLVVFRPPIGYTIEKSFPIDSLHYFKVDTAGYTSERIKRIGNTEIVKMIVKKSRIKGNFTIAHIPLNDAVLLQKDTLGNSKALYDAGISFHLIRKGKDFMLSADMPDAMIYHRGIANENIIRYVDFIGGAENKLMLYQYDYFRITDLLYGPRTFEEYERSELYLSDEKTGGSKKLLELSAPDFFRLDSKPEINSNRGIISELRVDYFESGKDLFVTMFLPEEGELMTQYPPLYHVGKTSGSLEKVPPIDKTSAARQGFLAIRCIILSNTRNGRPNAFLQNYQIVKKGDEFRLLKK